MIDSVMRFNLEAAPARFAELAHVVGAGSAEAFVPWLVRFKRDIGIPQGLAALNVTREHIPSLVAIAEQDICHRTNPRPCTREDFARFFEQAL
jgi:alcohol dehydrogenase class IV